MRRLFLLTVLVALVGTTSAQTSELDRSRLNTAAFYNYIDPGDVLTFEATIRQGFRWRDLFPVVSMVGTLVLILDRVEGE